MDATDETINLANLERFFLNRLQHFARIAAEADASGSPKWGRLARQATLTAYRDCVAIDLEAPAREILARSTTRRSLVV